MIGRAIDATADPKGAAPFLDAYLTRFPKAEGTLAAPGSPTILVRCRPR